VDANLERGVSDGEESGNEQEDEEESEEQADNDSATLPSEESEKGEEDVSEMEWKGLPTAKLHPAAYAEACTTLVEEPTTPEEEFLETVKPEATGG
jgi:hypothetical protein